MSHVSVMRVLIHHRKEPPSGQPNLNALQWRTFAISVRPHYD